MAARAVIVTMRTQAVVALALFALSSACAPAKPVMAPAVLPLRTLRLYETGVGYFERSGPLPSAEEAALPIPAGHLDDALKTLVVLSKGGKAQVGGIEFGSSLSHGMARAMAGLPQEENAPVTYEGLLTSLKGSTVEVVTPKGTVTGRLVDVEMVDEEPPKDDKDDKEKAPPKKPQPKLELTLLTGRAEVVHVHGTDTLSVRPTDPAQAARLDAALEALLAHGGQSRHSLRVLGDVGSEVTLGYIAETPVWRTTYRLVLPRDGSATLQAWALLHNDTDEDWKDVHVDLVNGRPDSFLFPLAAPRYAKRALVTPENELSTVPQLMGRTADTLWGDHVDDSYGAAGMGMTGYGSGGGGSGMGSGFGRIGTIGHGGGSGESIGASSLLAVGDLANVAQASGLEAGALFVYTMPNAVALRAHSSALVPFLQQGVDVERIAWVDVGTSVGRTAVRFTNSTLQTLPAGTISFFSDGGFAGESSLDRLKPKERRFLTFGADMDVDAIESVTNLVEATQKVTFNGDALREHFLRTTTAQWKVENRSGQPRAVYVALNLDTNATVGGADSADYDTETSKPLIVFRVPAQKSIERTVTSVEGLVRSTGLDVLTSKRLAEAAQLTPVPPSDKAIILEASGRAKDLEETRLELAAGRAEMKQLEQDLERLRTDAKAVGERGGVAQPLVTRIVAAEDRVGVVQKKVDALDKQATERSKLVRESLSRLPKG